MIRIGLFAALGLSTVLAAAAFGGDAAEKELKKHQGAWKLVSEEFDGKATPDSELEGVSRVVKGDEVIRKAGDLVGKSTLTIDAAKDPKQYDAKIFEGPGKGKVIKGIYKFDGDTLKTCADISGKGRPSAFSTKPGLGYSLQVWKRSKP